MRISTLLLTTTAMCVVVLVNFTELTEIISLRVGFNRTHCTPQLPLKSTAEVLITPGNSALDVRENGAEIYINCTETKPLRVLMGVLTKADSYERRHLLRMVYGIQKLETATVDVKFVICSLYKEDQKILVALEILRYDDILILDCAENMNNGKTFRYLSSLPSILKSRGMPPGYYDYVMKVDDDIFFKLDRLVTELSATPRMDSYYGFVIPCDSDDAFAKGHYMAGMGYALSWDLVEWISRSPIPRNASVGTEDKLVGEWFHKGGKARHRFNAKPRMYDFPGEHPTCSHELIAETVAVHKLKKRDRWFRVIEYFNLTVPAFESSSTLYRLD